MHLNLSYTVDAVDVNAVYMILVLWKFYLDANLLKRSCEGFCLNGGTCMLTSKGTSCSCILGFFGDRCENDGIS